MLLRALQYPSLFQSHWSVENEGDEAREKLTPEALFAPGETASGRYYVSSILQKDSASLKDFFAKVPFAEVPLLKSANATHDDGVWLFVGSNSARPASGKRKRDANVEPLRGRPEHTDTVNHSGTWHVQLQGHKTWFVRPCAEAHDWDSSPPVLVEGKEGVGKEGRRGLRLRIDCEMGDLLLINTRAWYHRTVINPQEASNLSISYARDFYLPGTQRESQTGCDGGKTNDDGLDPRMYATRNFRPGETILTGDDLPDAEFPRSAAPNCSMAVLDDDSEALVSLRRIIKGEPLTIGMGDESDPDEYEEWELDPATGEMVKVEEE